MVVVVVEAVVVVVERRGRVPGGNRDDGGDDAGVLVPVSRVVGGSVTPGVVVGELGGGCVEGTLTCPGAWGPAAAVSIDVTAGTASAPATTRVRTTRLTASSPCIRRSGGRG